VDRDAHRGIKGVLGGGKSGIVSFAMSEHSPEPLLSFFRSRTPALRGRDWSSNREGGFALVVVIWAIGVLSLLFVTYIAAARYRAIEAASRLQHAKAEAAAEAGINITVLNLLARTKNGKISVEGIQPGGSPVICAIADARVAILVADEGGKVDINTAMPDLIEALVAALRHDTSDVTAAVRAILDFRKPVSRLSAVEAGQLAGTPLASVYELSQVTGIDPILLQDLLPMVTVHSRTVGVDPLVAPARLVKALAPKRQDMPLAEARKNIPVLFSAESSGRAFQISVEAKTARGTRVSKDAVVEFTLEPPVGYRIREWRDGSRRLGRSNEFEGSAPPC
jgi:general secretion pathway protein K